MKFGIYSNQILLKIAVQFFEFIDEKNRLSHKFSNYDKAKVYEYLLMQIFLVRFIHLKQKTFCEQKLNHSKSQFARFEYFQVIILLKLFLLDDR